jgi:galactose-1-phosphate uridylyltransferase
MISTQSHSTRLTVAFAAFLAAVCLPAQAEKPMAEFQAENIAAMNKMMADMAIEYSNDIDRDFASMMIPHHQGAIDMAVAELRYGHNEQLRRIAQEIIVDQLQEITAMRLALSDSLPASSAAATQPDAAAPAGMQRPAPSSTGFKP